MILKYNGGKMNVIVIGLGSMGKRRIRLMKAMRLPVDIIGIDNREDRLRTVAKEFNIRCYQSLEAAEKEEIIECAFICTSPLAHAELIRICLDHGYHVFTEINLVSDQYKTNIEISEKKNLTLFLSSTPIYRDEMRKIIEITNACDSGVSYVYHVGQYLPDWHPWEQYKEFFVGDSRTNGCREIFAIELPWLVKAFGNIKSIQSISKKLTSLDVPYNDTYLVQILHENGNTGVFAVDVVCRKPIRRLEVYNEDMYIEWEGTPKTLKQYSLITHNMESIECGTYRSEPGYSEFINETAYMNEIREFFEVIKGKKPEYTMKMDEQILKLIDEIENVENMR